MNRATTAKARVSAMPKRRVLVSSDEATPISRQHTKPCSDCPWRRDSLPGWLGPATAVEWVQAAHSDMAIDCHVHPNQQCAGSSIYRANVCKMSREKDVLRLPANRETVFARPDEFKEHHG